jgi:3-keto-5-aminohexanoate cleavage enzyme
MTASSAVMIEAALNGNRDRAENPAVPYTVDEIAAEARRCADEGATVFHVHAREADGGWTTDPARYAEVVCRLHADIPDGLVSITSLRPQGVPVDAILDLLADLARDAATKPDLISVNLGHIAVWEPDGSGPYRRRTVHYPNAYEDIVQLLSACARHGIRPELGIMDLGFISNAVALRDDNVVPADAWFLIELDSPAYGAGSQVAPATVANYDALAAAMREQFPQGSWAAHGAGLAGYAVITRALADGSHLRVGFEDAIHHPGGHIARGNADLIAWAANAAREAGRHVATFAETRAIIGCGARPN